MNKKNSWDLLKSISKHPKYWENRYIPDPSVIEYFMSTVPDAISNEAQNNSVCRVFSPLSNGIWTNFVGLMMKKKSTKN